MSKPRALSVPSVLSDSHGAGQFLSQTLPAQIPRDQRCAMAFPAIGASMLLSMDVSHTGWGRKEGFGYRSWKSRFMVLHHGCIYYFKDTDSNTPKGKFALNGYRCYAAPERENADRYPYVFKLVPDDEHLRTYFISSPSKREMEGWINSITNDIETYCPSEYDYVPNWEVDKLPTCPTIPRGVPQLQQREQGRCNLGKTLPHSFPTSAITKPTPLLPPRRDVSDPDQQLYESVDARSFGEVGEDLYLPVIPDETDGCSSAEHKLPTAYNGRPLPPVRPTPPPRPPDMHEDSESDDADSDDDAPYVDSRFIRVQSPVSPKRNGVSPTTPERERPIPLPRAPTNGTDHVSDVDVTYLPVIDIQEIKRENDKDNAQKTPIPPPRLGPKPPRPTTTDDKYLPPDCYKPKMSKEQAKIFLELGRTVGEYIINASQSSDTGMSLSVWVGTGVKRYLIFKREEKYSLDPSLFNEQFNELRQLVEYYYSHSLPKSSRRLTKPFASQQ